MFSSVSRALVFLARTPILPPVPSGPAAVELSTFSSAAAAGPSRPRAVSRGISSMSIKSGFAGAIPMQSRGYASGHGKKELYSDEAGSTGAGTDDVAHSDAAFDKDPNPDSSAKKIENETGKDFTRNSAANPEYSDSPGKQGEHGQEPPLNTSRHGAKH